MKSRRHCLLREMCERRKGGEKRSIAEGSDNYSYTQQKKKLMGLNQVISFSTAALHNVCPSET